MKPWMIPWLFPAAIIVLLVLFALLPSWVVGLVALALVFVVVPVIWRSYGEVHPDRQLPGWLPGGRPPR